MASWAAVAEAQPPAKPSAGAVVHAGEQTVAVVDANAIISGPMRLQGLADQLVTTPAVLAEIRDKQSRQVLALLPQGLAAQGPHDASVAAVTRFARATGDLHSLSAADVGLIALAHTLEVAAHGSDHLLELPAMPQVVKGGGPDALKLPGWGSRGGEWADMDALAEEELRAAEAASHSKVSAAVHALSLADADSQHSSQVATAVEPGVAMALQGAAAEAPQEQQDGAGSAWETAASSHNADRKRRRRQARRAAKEAAWQGANASASEAPAPSLAGAAQLRERLQHLQLAPGAGQAGEAPAAGSAADVVAPRTPDATAQQQVAGAREEEQQQQQQEQEQQQQSADLLAAAPCLPAATAAAPAGEQHEAWLDQSEGESDQSEDDGSSGGSSCSNASGASQAFESTVVSVTGDFAMQNVILQMGLRLAAPDGLQVARLARWALRCSACFNVCKEPGRLFCPHCGNATLEKVEVVVSPAGMETYGVRRRHNLRGTRFPLPKPQGGHQSKAPILREDVLLQKLQKRRNRRPAAEPDAFAPEYGPDSWFVKNHGSSAQYKGAAAALAAWKHNPNERRHVRTNRRKK